MSITDIISSLPYLTAEQKIVYIVYRATLDVMREQDEKLEKFAQQLRDAVDCGN